ncbi:hypothetical protein EDC94DRAFT_697763 [Helicostylum pulchrum]|nr:hypothetical protein EDC94DRAFT_697763 [Helicostylum pulchrum]
MRRKKRRQFLRATPALNQLPTWRRKGQKRARRNLLESENESEPTDKKTKDAEGEEELLEAFHREMKRRHSRTIQDCIDSGKRLDGLKDQCMTKKRLDRGIVTGAEERIGAHAAEIENMLRKRRKTQTPLQRWFELVEKISLIKEDEYGASSSRAVSKTQTVESLHHPEESSDNPTELDTNEKEDEKTRHCSSSLLPLIRSVLPDDIKDTFLRVLKRKLTAATDYTTSCTGAGTEQKRQLYISEKEATTIQRPISIIKKSRNGKRNLFNNERRQRRKYVKKAKDDPVNEQKWINKAIRCTERIETYAKTLAIERTKAIDIDPSDTSDIEAIEKEDEEVVGKSTDLSRKRLGVFRSILRQVIFKYHGQHITEAEVRDISNTTYTKEEIRVLSSIANLLMPYIPTKQTWYTTAYQILFILMSNDIMRDTGYQKSCVAVSPLSKPNSLHCFKIDAPTLFSSFCDSNLEQPMDIYGCNAHVWRYIPHFRP